MAQQNDSQVLELFQFLADPQAPVRRIALATLLPYTAPDAPERKLFLRDSHVEQIATIMLEVVQRLHKLPGFVTGLVRLIVDEKALLSDLACMLLSNMSKLDSVSRQILGLRVPVGTKSSAVEGEAAAATEADDEIAALDLLLEVFLRGEGKKYNPNANYDFLASVFANVSLLPQGRAFLLATPDRSVEPPLAKIISFTEHPSTIRRGGVASTIKNAAFEKAGHTRLVASSNDGPAEEGCIDLLVQLLLPLCGNEEFDIDVLDELPSELQLLPSDKTREPDPQIRTILVETLVLLATNRSNREAMRKRGVYPVIKEAHLKETVPGVKEAMVRLVNLLMRDEGTDTALEEVDAHTDPADLPPAPSFENNSNFVQHQEAPAEEVTKEQEVKEDQVQREKQEKEDERPQHHNVPLSRMQPEEDEEEMLLEV
ncbi:Protein HGH1 [Rhodotorula toruloides]|nr:Protein HGH1 [Rhodotorula toruloides]